MEQGPESMIVGVKKSVKAQEFFWVIFAVCSRTLSCKNDIFTINECRTLIEEVLLHFCIFWTYLSVLIFILFFNKYHENLIIYAIKQFFHGYLLSGLLRVVDICQICAFTNQNPISKLFFITYLKKIDFCYESLLLGLDMRFSLFYSLRL